MIFIFYRLCRGVAWRFCLAVHEIFSLHRFFREQSGQQVRTTGSSGQTSFCKLSPENSVVPTYRLAVPCPLYSEDVRALELRASWKERGNRAEAWARRFTLSKFIMAGETVELSQLPIPHLENLRSQLEEVSIRLLKGLKLYRLGTLWVNCAFHLGSKIARGFHEPAQSRPAKVRRFKRKCQETNK